MVTNIHLTIAKYLFDLVIDLKGVEIIPDYYEAVAETIQRLSSQHDFIFTSRGILPAHDDFFLAHVIYIERSRNLAKDNINVTE
jgi:molybdopterin-biosynthesis enzyme MoeA-like protein